MGYAKRLSIILVARKRSSTVSAFHSFLIGAIIIGAFLAVNGLVEPVSFVYVAIIALLIVMFSPQLSSGSMYEDLLDSLENKFEP